MFLNCTTLVIQINCLDFSGNYCREYGSLNFFKKNVECEYEQNTSYIKFSPASCC